jgi:predicted RNA-binding protein YlqC (UPF0109 family)
MIGRQGRMADSIPLTAAGTKLRKRIKLEIIE